MGLPAPTEAAAGLPLGAQGYLLASWNAAAMASSQHWESGDMRGRPVSPRMKVSWPAARATVATRLQARIMSNCTGGAERKEGRWSAQAGGSGWVSPPGAHPSLSADSLTELPLPPNPGSVHPAPPPAPSPGVRCKGHTHRAEGAQSSVVGGPQRPGAGASGPFPAALLDSQGGHHRAK